VVLVGYGRVGELLGEILLHRKTPFLAVDLDQCRLRRLALRGGRTLYGDAAMSEVLEHSWLPEARILVVAVPDPTTSMLVVEQARRLNPTLEIIVRVARTEDVQEFYDLGVKDVVQPEFEAGLALIRAALTRLTCPPHEIHTYWAKLRAHHASDPIEVDLGPGYPEDLLRPPVGSDAAWFRLRSDSTLIGKSLHEADIDGRTGATLLVLRKGERHILHPESDNRLDVDDHILVLGTPEQHEEVVNLLHPETRPRVQGDGGRVWLSRLDELVPSREPPSEPRP
jgi:CPA2 family monovalent cation:H+ antiporter-2